MHNSVNRNVGVGKKQPAHKQWHVEDWWGLEDKIHEHLQNGNVRWEVDVNYPDGGGRTSGRPSSFRYKAIFEDLAGNEVDRSEGVVRNGPPNSGF